MCIQLSSSLHFYLLYLYFNSYDRLCILPGQTESSLTPSHHVFLGRPLVPSTSIVVQHLIQSVSAFRSTVSNPSQSTFLNHQTDRIKSQQFSQFCIHYHHHYCYYMYHMPCLHRWHGTGSGCLRTLLTFSRWSQDSSVHVRSLTLTNMTLTLMWCLQTVRTLVTVQCHVTEIVNFITIIF